jgi:hypothetical protein
MTILFSALAIAAAPAPATVQPATPAMQGTHAQHSQQAQQSGAPAKATGRGCSCCKDMGGMMEGGAKRGEGHGAGHSGHSTNR